jgi:hypothetical protein
MVMHMVMFETIRLLNDSVDRQLDTSGYDSWS